MKNTISNSDDVIDSRDIIAQIEELESMLPDTAELAMPGTSEELEGMREELETLKALAEEGEAYAPDWRYGETLIRDSYFIEYAEELAGDIGAIDPKASWPLNHIDWEDAADSLKQDYASIKFDGVTYWIRSC